jgi:hypothetical protein
MQPQQPRRAQPAAPRPAPLPAAWLAALLGLAITLPAERARAGMDNKALQIAAKAIGFAKPAGAAGAKLVVVGGAADTAAVQGALPNFTVTAGSAQDATGAFAAFVSSAAEGKAIGPKVLLIGPLDCVEAGVCTIAVETTPKVSIYLSNAAAAAAGIDFEPGFKVLATSK